MDLNVLNRVTPIKMERIDSHDLSFCSEADSSYFSLNEWENNGTCGDRGALHPSPGAGSLGVSPVSSSPVRKSLFAGVDEGINRSDGDSNSVCRNLNAAMQNDEGLQDDSFPNIWKSISIDRNDLTVSDPIFAFSETEGPLENQISLEVLSTIEDFPTFSNSQSTVATTEVSALANQQHSQLPCHNANVAALNQENENTYQCSPSYGNGAIMRSYSNDLPQHNATTLPNLVVSSAQQPGLVQHPNHHGMVTYQSTSPHNGEGPNSTHSSPYTPSPTGGYEYPTSPPSAKPSIPSNTDYPGDYNFQINFGEATVSAPKSAQYTYSHSLNKLFVKMNVTCPIKFKCDRPAPINCIIRAVPVFKRPEHVTDVATRCPNHKIPDEVNYNLQSSHLIRAEMPNDTQVRYEVAPQDGRESVSVFYERPQVGAEFTTILYKFMCLSSCVGGINRRPLLTVFTLEYDGQVLGRRVVEVRICSCPGRDRSQEEKKQRYTSPHHQNGPVDGSSKRPFKNLQGTMEILQTVPSNKKRRLTQANGDQEEFTLKIRGREKYEMLKRLKEALDLMDYVGTDQVAAYRRQEEEHAKLSSGASTSSSVQPAEQASSSAQPTSACILTVAEPLPPSSAPLLDSQPFSLTPTHSSHPLTVTPTGDSYVGHNTQPQGYWESPSGHDVPESSNVLKPERQPSISTFPSLESQSLMDTQPLLREASGVSTLSSCSGRQDFGRHVTRITLRQTISLNCDTGHVKTTSKKNVKMENAPKLDKVVSSDDETWLPAHVKSEVPDDPLTLSQQMEADSAGGIQLF